MRAATRGDEGWYRDNPISDVAPFAAFTQRLATSSDVLSGGKSGGGTISKSFRVDCKRDVVLHLTGLIDQ